MVWAAWPKELINLPLVLAYCSLEEVLGQLVQEGHFCGQSLKLAGLMDASQAVVPWQNYPLVNDGRRQRNKLAHEGLFVPRDRALQLIEAIEFELKAWQVLL